MKTYLIGMCAILLAFGFGAFKTNSKATKTFRFVAPGYDFTTGAVENPQNWVLAPQAIYCTGSNKACTVDIDDQYVLNPHAIRLDQMDPGILLEAESGSVEAALYGVEVTGVWIHVDIRNQP